MHSKKHLISTWLKDRIYSGSYKIGSLLPSENSLAELMGVSRPTVRSVLNILVHEGLIFPIQGVGYEVIRNKAASNVILQFDSLDALVDFNNQNSKFILEKIKCISSDFLKKNGLLEKNVSSWNGLLFSRNMHLWDAKSYVAEIIIHPLFQSCLDHFEEMKEPCFKYIEKALNFKLKINQYICILNKKSFLRDKYLDRDEDYFDIYRIYTDEKGDVYQVTRNIISSSKFYHHTILHEK